MQLVKNSEAGILLTSYDQLRLQRSELLAVNWGYAILDEGHKIRNPDAEVSPNSQQADIVIIPPHHMLTVPFSLSMALPPLSQRLCSSETCSC